MTPSTIAGRIYNVYYNQNCFSCGFVSNILSFTDGLGIGRSFFDDLPKSYDPFVYIAAILATGGCDSGS